MCLPIRWQFVWSFLTRFLFLHLSSRHYWISEKWDSRMIWQSEKDVMPWKFKTTKNKVFWWYSFNEKTDCGSSLGTVFSKLLQILKGTVSTLCTFFIIIQLQMNESNWSPLRWHSSEQTFQVFTCSVSWCILMGSCIALVRSVDASFYGFLEPTKQAISKTRPSKDRPYMDGFYNFAAGIRNWFTVLRDVCL